MKSAAAIAFCVVLDKEVEDLPLAVG